MFLHIAAPSKSNVRLKTVGAASQVQPAKPRITDSVLSSRGAAMSDKTLSVRNKFACPRFSECVSTWHESSMGQKTNYRTGSRVSLWIVVFPLISVILFPGALLLFLVYLVNDSALNGGGAYGYGAAIFVGTLCGAGFPISTVSSAVAMTCDRRWRWPLLLVQIPCCVWFCWEILPLLSL